MKYQEIWDTLHACEHWGEGNAPGVDELLESIEWWNGKVPIEKLEVSESGTCLDITFKHVIGIEIAMDMGNICDFYDISDDFLSYTLWWRG